MGMRLKMNRTMLTSRKQAGATRRTRSEWVIGASDSGEWMMSRSGMATSAATTRLLSGPANATSAWPRRPWRRFRGLTGVGLAQPKRNRAAELKMRGDDQEYAAHLVEVDARVEAQAALPARGVVTQPIGRPGVQELVDRESHEQHDPMKATSAAA